MNNRYFMLPIAIGIILLLGLFSHQATAQESTGTDVIIGNWQEVSYNGAGNTVFAYQCHADYSLTVLKSGAVYGSGTWSNNGGTYTFSLAGMGAVSFTPIFDSSSATMTYTDAKGFVSVYSRK